VENDRSTGEVADRLEALAAELKAGAREALPEPERK
jgi:tryptophan synthase alpha chain